MAARGRCLTTFRHPVRLSALDKLTARTCRRAGASGYSRRLTLTRPARRARSRARGASMRHPRRRGSRSTRRPDVPSAAPARCRSCPRTCPGTGGLVQSPVRRGAARRLPRAHERPLRATAAPRARPNPSRDAGGRDTASAPRRFTRAELAAYNGKTPGRRMLIAYKGKVYDVTCSYPWAVGVH